MFSTRLPAAVRATVEPHAGVVGVLAAHDGGSGGAAKGLETKAFWKLMPLSPKRERVFGMSRRSSLRMSSARMKTMLGLAGLAWTSLERLSQQLGRGTVAAMTKDPRRISGADLRERRPHGPDQGLASAGPGPTQSSPLSLEKACSIGLRSGA